MGAVTTFWAPVHRALARIAPGSTGLPLNAAPGIEYLASGIQDHRYPYNARGSSATLPGILSWYGGAEPIVANIVPSTIATANIAALANAVSGTAMTLVSSSGAGITVLSTSAPAIFYTANTTATTGVVIDGLPSYHLFGASGTFTTGFYNRSTTVGRCISITGVSGGAGGTFLAVGYDCYGYAMSELITATSGATTSNSKKAFKVITSITPQFSDAHNYSIGTADIFGFGILASFFGDVSIVWNAAVITATTGFTAAVTTSPATTITGDVRGTYAVQSASDAAKRLVVRVSPTLGSLVTNPTTGLFGVAQV